MKVGAIRYIILFCVIAVGYTSVHATAPLKAFPSDTVWRFVNTYGEDSLLELLDARINMATNFIYVNTENIGSPMLAMEFRLVARNFKSEIAEVPFLAISYDNYFYRLYGAYLGDTLQLFPFMEDLNKKNKGNLRITSRDIKEEMSRIGVASFCDRSGLAKSVVDTLFSFRKKLSSADKIQNYWVLGELSRNCPELHTDIQTMLQTYYKELSKQYTLKKIYSSATPFSIKAMESFNLYYPMRTLAYALYAKESSLDSYSEELMYLLSMQNTVDGGWSTYYQKEKEGEISTTVYAWWALLEFRDRWQNIKTNK